MNFWVKQIWLFSNYMGDHLAKVDAISNQSLHLKNSWKHK